MPSNALYVYGIVKSRPTEWRELGVNEENVYAINEGEFNALVHNCEEKPYISEDPNKIKELIIAHNKILDKAMKDFNGVIPLSFNTIIKKGENSPEHNLKKWLDDNKERLGKTWNKIKAKREYGIRIYYEKDKLVQEISSNTEIKELEESQQGKSQGLSYLLQGKLKSKINEILQNRINQFKQKFFNDIKKITNIKVNTSSIFIDEEKDLLLSLSVLADKQQIDKVKGILEADKDFSFQLAGPFAPYSFVEK
nr:hypothetical protein [Nanoarchaeum sp.]